MNFMYYVYILRSLAKTDETYIGYTERMPEHRLQDHNGGLQRTPINSSPGKSFGFAPLRID
jgi:predicted GIY-YIG superfamily endonuclease